VVPRALPQGSRAADDDVRGGPHDDHNKDDHHYHHHYDHHDTASTAHTGTDGGRDHAADASSGTELPEWHLRELEWEHGVQPVLIAEWASRRSHRPMQRRHV